MGLAIAEVGLGFVGFDLVELVTGIGDAADLSDAAAFAEALADLIDGMATIGAMILARKLIAMIFHAATQRKRERVWKKRAAHIALKALNDGLRRNVPLPGLAVLVQAAKRTDYYTARL